MVKEVGYELEKKRDYLDGRKKKRDKRKGFRK